MLLWPAEQICPGCFYSESEALNTSQFYSYLNELLSCQRFALEADFAALSCSCHENVFILAHSKAPLQASGTDPKYHCPQIQRKSGHFHLLPQVY